MPENRAGWWWKTASQWEEETGLTRREQDTARKRLRKTAFWQEKREGIPARLWYRLNSEKLEESLKNSDAHIRQTGMAEPATLDAHIRQTGMAESAKQQETTTQTTKDYNSRGGVLRSALENQNPVLPPVIPRCEQAGLVRQLSNLNDSMREEIVAALIAKLELVEAGQSAPVADVQAYCSGLIRKANTNELGVSSAVAEKDCNSELTKKISAIQDRLADGGRLYIDGHRVEMESGGLLVRMEGGCANLAQLIKDGAQVEVRQT